jgi:hypothetical protein
VTLAAFAKKLGWPLDEFMEMDWLTAVEIANLYGYQIKLIPIRRTKRGR